MKGIRISSIEGPRQITLREGQSLENYIEERNALITPDSRIGKSRYDPVKDRKVKRVYGLVIGSGFGIYYLIRTIIESIRTADDSHDWEDE